jgi:hypothetical protein
MLMRVLIADRNAMLLESVSRTFAYQCSIQTATTRERCDELLRSGGFELAIVSEKLADGPGLQLLGQLARNSPDTLRVFTARRSRLQLLEGKLGPFGLFRTLVYPIDSRDLLSVLTLARSMRSTVERISLTSADARLEINVPMLFASMRTVRDASPLPPSALPQAQAARPADCADLSLQGKPFRQTAVRPNGPVNRAMAGADRGLATDRRVASRSPRQELERTAPKRTKVALGATVVAVFVLTTLTLNLLDATVHFTRASAPRPEVAPPPTIATSRSDSGSMPVVRPTPSMARRIEPKPEATPSDQRPADPQFASSTVPVADPSTFGSEAYEPIYPN